MKYLVIFLLLGIVTFSAIPSIYAPPEPMPDDSFRFSDYVLTGKVISSEVIPNPNEDTAQKKYRDTVVYEIKVIEWHKNPLNNSTITVYGDHYPNDVEPEPMWGVVEFEIGSTVYLYLDSTEDGLKFREHASYLVKYHSENDKESIKNNVQVEIIPDEDIYYGEKFTIHAWLSDYEKKSNDSGYFIDVLDQQNNQIDSTLWLAKNDFLYVFDTIHPSYNITPDETFTIRIEKADSMQRTGIFSDMLEFEIKKRFDVLPPLKQFRIGVLPNDIICKENLVLIQKHNNLPACVTESTQLKLIERGWTGNEILKHTPDEKSVTPPNRMFDARDRAAYDDAFPITHKNNVTSQELQEKLELVRNAKIGIVSSGIDYDIGQLVFYAPDPLIRQDIEMILGDFPFVVLYEESSQLANHQRYDDLKEPKP